MDKVILYLFIISIGLTSCMKNECPDCETPPPPLYFQILDNETDSDLILNGRLVPDSFFLYSSSIEPVSFTIEKEDGRVLVNLSELMWTLGDSQHRLAVKGTDTTDRINIDFSFTTIKDTLTDDCCTIYENSDFKIYNRAYERDIASGLTKVKISL